MALISFIVAQINQLKAATSGAMPTTILDFVITDHTAFLVHVYLLAGDVLATIAVGVGIVWEHGSAEVRVVANRLVIWGVVAETLCSLALFSFDEKISGAQESTIGAQQSKIIALETRIAPRQLTSDQQKSIADALASHTGKKVALSSYLLDTDAATLANQVREALHLAKIETDDSLLMSIVGAGGQIQLAIHVTGKDAWFVSDLLSVLGKYQTVSNAEPFRRGFVAFVGGVIATANGSSGACRAADACIFVGVKPITQ
jgi:hypothetical protein